MLSKNCFRSLPSTISEKRSKQLLYNIRAESCCLRAHLASQNEINAIQNYFSDFFKYSALSCDSMLGREIGTFPFSPNLWKFAVWPGCICLPLKPKAGCVSGTSNQTAPVPSKHTRQQRLLHANENTRLNSICQAVQFTKQHICNAF